ncbi:MAG: sugar kinase [Dermatophilaceae bacterium]
MTVGSGGAAAGAEAVVTVGESLGLVMGGAAGPIRAGGPARFSFAGAESNVAIGLARLGHRVCFVSRVGDDVAGRAVVESLRGEGVDVGRVTVDTAAPTALMVRQHRTADVLTVDYYRSGSAASALSVDDVPDALIQGARLLHVSGITPALSTSAHAATVHALDTAHRAAVPVSLDVNYRARLWSPQQACDTLRRLLPHVDLVFGGEEELALLAPAAGVDGSVRDILAAGPTTVVRKRGAAGATAYGPFGQCDVAAVAVTAVDPVGAGDAFVAGYLSALLDGLDVTACLDRGAECGAFAVSVHGDWEGLPRRSELGLLRRVERVQR